MNIPTELLSRLIDAGHPLEELSAVAHEVVLFGSRAVGCERADSDWDVLILGSQTRCRTRSHALDLVWVSPEAYASGLWFSMELATHVAAFGRWLHGEPRWLRDVRPDLAASAKANTLRQGIANLEMFADHISPTRAKRHLRTIRLDAQRWRLLREGHPVPPTAWLENAWQHTRQSERECLVEEVLAQGTPSETMRRLWHAELRLGEEI